MKILALLIILVAIEIFLQISVRFLKKSSSWLVTKQDELPHFNPQGLEKFFNYSFDHHLGWVRKPNTSGTEKGQHGNITFHINAIGARTSQFKDKKPVIAAFGDSYTFARQVTDNETWEEQLAAMEDYGVLNFGVGNYGVDQALLRYESQDLPNSIKITVLGFVPETICRIQSYWKHYLEFGNTFAFKPRFIIDNHGSLTLLENPIKHIDDFQQLKEKLDHIQANDKFYLNKFRSLQFTFPYVISFARHPLRHAELISSGLLNQCLGFIGKQNSWSQNLPFSMVMKNNIKDSHKLYQEESSTKLLDALIQRFQCQAASKGHTPIILVLPQLMDLKFAKRRKIPYQSYFEKAGKSLNVIDMTETFLNFEIEQLFINDQYGGHLSVLGNQLVAKELSAFVKGGRLTSRTTS